MPPLSPFAHLEIGLPAGVSSAGAPQALAGPDDIACPYCGRPNEKQREVCWACCKILKGNDARTAAAPPQDLTLVLDGETYSSTDPGLPDDVRVLIDRIRKEGYTPKLLAEWRSWRAVRNSGAVPQVPEPSNANAIKVVQDSSRSVIRIDGRLYHSDDPDLPTELRRLFEYLARDGVTPELMDHLRRYGNKAKLRPHTTARPSDGDLAFWDHVNEEPQARGKTPVIVATARFVAASTLLSLPVIFFLGAGGSIVAMTYRENTRTRRLVEAQSASAEATVTRIRSESRERRSNRLSSKWVACVFTASDGVEAGCDAWSGPETEVGAKIRVRYDPKDPKSCANSGFGTMPDPVLTRFPYVFAGIFISAGLVCLSRIIPALRDLWPRT